MASWSNQFSTGDQGSNKEAFWRTGFKLCQQCHESGTIETNEVPAGCRMNGYAYGTTVFTCGSCGWKTSFQWDEAGEGPYYYETRGYTRTPPRPKPPHPWAGISLDEWYRSHQIDPRIQSKLRIYAIKATELADMDARRFKALGLKEEEAQQVLQAIRATNEQRGNNSSIPTQETERRTDAKPPATSQQSATSKNKVSGSLLSSGTFITILCLCFFHGYAQSDFFLEDTTAPSASTSSSSSSSDMHGSNTQQSSSSYYSSDFNDVRRPVVVDLPKLGKVRGQRANGVDFFGALPYAAPPVGSRRFAPPEPPAPWSPATLDASQYGADCWQLVDQFNPGADVAHMSEDCLFVNIHVPAGQEQPSSSSSSSSKKLLPVMVWLHGGAFQQGGARREEYDGRRLAERGTVVVTLNYRLGALGFLVSSPDGLFGNFGLMDQRAALHWIQENIAYFGGDPNNVMLFGESAGAVMTVLHLMMDGAGKLFHKVSIQSNPLGLQFRSVVVADFIGEALKQAVDCRDLSCLRAERVEEIMRAQSTLMGIPRSVGDL